MMKFGLKKTNNKMANTYKTFTWADVDNNQPTTATAQEKTDINNTISDFITYFKAKHI